MNAASPINAESKVTVVGAGIMGRGIVHAFAVRGFPVALFDVKAAALDDALGNIRDIVAGAVKIGKLTEAQAAETLARITVGTDLADSARGADLVVETASERLDVKIDIIRTIDPVVAADAIIATNTSALSITEIAAASANPARVAGMHFFNPVHKMKLVEIIRGLATDETVIARLKAWSDALGKTSIVVNEAPGFTTSRMSAMLGNEAMYMLESGVASAEDIDTALRLGLGHPMGPLELGDMTGWDTRLAVLQYLHQSLGEKFRPCPLIAKMVKSGRTGRKVGHGVYKYENGAKVPGSGLGSV
ncbi:3-hydroxyacyl-CoA dehydrogenase [Azospirillum doebereinerae]|uniref:3-hydroxyacyl-CoA dehydrogenase n=1 Tax=Azospirillum doebereinerae TaxID=92933 RepID=A0A3S0VFZ1_9PROT|nr:3-hydroxyacyl-CoA dehydrogenase [Azospirillum doebereinerae]MCG5238288.1 3-hydroxyacyl-CoA dehydrogenase [Azospirillum doebereinerae]RUQ66828.1 3-hydroxyacyl-CoA dehydrogenase [Azospirillum doebereinerae]